MSSSNSDMIMQMADFEVGFYIIQNFYLYNKISLSATIGRICEDAVNVDNARVNYHFLDLSYTLSRQLYEYHYIRRPSNIYIHI